MEIVEILKTFSDFTGMGLLGFGIFVFWRLHSSRKEDGDTGNTGHYDRQFSRLRKTLDTLENNHLHTIEAKMNTLHDKMDRIGDKIDDNNKGIFEQTVILGNIQKLLEKD